MYLKFLATLAALTLLSGTASFAETISTHVLDLERGVGGADVPVSLAQKQADGTWTEIATAKTDDNGRVKEFPGVETATGIYKLAFDMSGYGERGSKAFFPEINLVFQIDDPSQHYHVPVVVSPFGYSTYRGN